MKLIMFFKWNILICGYEMDDGFKMVFNYNYERNGLYFNGISYGNEMSDGFEMVNCEIVYVSEKVDGYEMDYGYDMDEHRWNEND